MIMHFPKNLSSIHQKLGELFILNQATGLCSPLHSTADLYSLHMANHA